MNTVLKQMLLGTAIFLTEYILLSVNFDIWPLLKGDSWFRYIGYLGTIFPLVFVIFTALFLIAGKQLRKDLVIASQTVLYKNNRFLWLIHVIFFLLLFVLTGLIISKNSLLLLWIPVAIITGGSALFLAFPPKLLYFFLKRTQKKTLLCGIVVGIAAWSAAIVSADLWNPLGQYTFYFVAWFMRFLPGELLINLEKMVVGTSNFSVIIAPICAGYQGLGLMLIFISAYLFWLRKSLRFPSALISRRRRYPRKANSSIMGTMIQVPAIRKNIWIPKIEVDKADS